MSKERLEEIDKRAKHKVLGNIEGEIKYRLTEINTEDYEWLIEQAERVQELENHIDHLYDNNVHLKGDYRLQEQNKRYREAIEKALYESTWGDEGNALAKMISILAEALRGE